MLTTPTTARTPAQPVTDRRGSFGVDLEGHRDILGMWAGQAAGESSKFWLAVLTDLRNRGVRDEVFVVCDGLKGLPDSVNATWPDAIVHMHRPLCRPPRYADVVGKTDLAPTPPLESPDTPGQFSHCVRTL